MIVWAGAISSQGQSANIPSQLNYPVGVWESEQPDGSAIGIDLAEETESVPSGGEGDGDVPQTKVVLVVGAFHREHLRINCGEETFFVIGRRSGNHDVDESRYANGRLQIQYYDHVHGATIELDLLLDPIKEVWTGHFLRETLYGRLHPQSFDGEVELHRTSPQSDPARGGCSPIRTQ